MYSDKHICTHKNQPFWYNHIFWLVHLGELCWGNVCKWDILRNSEGSTQYKNSQRPPAEPEAWDSVNRSKRFILLAPSKGASCLLLKQGQLLQPLILLFLLLDVLPDRFFISANRWHEISACPKALPCEVLLFTHEISSNCYRTFALDKPHHMRHGVFRWNLYQHMHMINTHMPLDYVALLLLGKWPKYLTKYWRMFSYIRLRRYFGIHTMWYLHSHLQCDKLFTSFDIKASYCLELWPVHL